MKYSKVNDPLLSRSKSIHVPLLQETFSKEASHLKFKGVLRLLMGLWALCVLYIWHASEPMQERVLWLVHPSLDDIMSRYEIIIAILVLQFYLSEQVHNIKYWKWTLLASYLFTDFATGIYHVIDDYFFGLSFIQNGCIAFGDKLDKPHHKEVMSYDSFNARQCIYIGLLAYPFIMPLWFLLNRRYPSFRSQVALFFLLTTMQQFWAGVYVHNAAHRRHHDMEIPSIVWILQDLRILIHPEYHKNHHEGFNSTWAIYHGWTNFIIDPIVHLLVILGIFPSCH